jgi:hypothetical protein
VTTIGLGAALMRTAPAGEDETVYFFFSPDTPAPAAARAAVEAARRGRVRPCLLVADFRKSPEGDPDFLETVRILGGPISIYDLEAVALAKRFGVRRLPAVVVARNGRIHVCYGDRISRKEVGSCSK